MKPNKVYDVIICGGGHAGVEAALISAHLSCSVLLVTLDSTAVGRMSCNPAIGGLAKGQIVKEIDVLGGAMGLTTDSAGLQFKILNKTKGKSVWSPRAQVDKRKYEKLVSARIKKSKNIHILEGEAVDVVVRKNKVSGVRLRDKTNLMAECVILTCGTFLSGLIHIGQKKIRAGRMGESGSEGLTESLVALGFKSARLKTGTPPRLDKKTINWEKTNVIYGDKNPMPFSYRTKSFSPPSLPCHTIQTNLISKEIIEENIAESPMFSGDVLGVGPRYCPSIEDKVFNFPHHNTHTLFLEPEWFNSDQIYLNGFSTSLPEAVQIKALRSIPGMERVVFFRPGYAIEYDFFPPAQLKSSLETKGVEGLFFAGQINGTSGYEEAAAQGLIAGINASSKVKGVEPLILNRSDAYIGVMIDDLITKDTAEPYRMFTSRAEYRILLRFSNAPARLFHLARERGLLGVNDVKTIEKRERFLQKTIRSFDKKIHPKDINPTLLTALEAPITTPTTIAKILKRPNISINNLPEHVFSFNKQKNLEVVVESESTIKYQGYIKRQEKHIEQMKKHENKQIPRDIDYTKISSLSNEAREKLSFVCPQTLGQASRVSGVTPADASVLAVLLTKRT